MSYGSLSKKSPETAPSPGKFSSRVYETNINTCWMKFSETFKLFAFQEDSKKSFCPWQVLGFLGLNLKKIETRSHFRQSVPEMASARDLGMKEPTWSEKMRSVLFLHGSFSLNSSGGRDWYFQRAEEEMES